MDLVIPLGKGSIWENNELRYTLRSIEKYISGIDRLFIVGERPHWLTGPVIHIPHADIYGSLNRDANILLKILSACNDERLSNNFLYASDDHFILRPDHAMNYPFYYKGELPETISKTDTRFPYWNTLTNTLGLLNKYSLSLADFQLHCPIVYSKEQFKKLVFDLGHHLTIKYGFAIKSMYCNYFGIQGVQYTDLKIGEALNYDQLKNITGGRAFFSIANRALKGDIKQFLEDLYPVKSKFEI